MRSRSIAVVTALTLSLVSGQAALGGTKDAPEISDPAGDAYFVNGQGLVNGVQPPGTPASRDSADFTAIWFDTTYTTVAVRDDSGAVRAVKHVADGLGVNIQTVAPAKPTFGPGVVFRVPRSVGACNFNIEMWISGSGAGTILERDERANVSKLNSSSCPGGGTGIAGVTMTLQGNVARIAIPFAGSAGLFADGVRLDPYTSRPHVRTQFGVTAPVVDETDGGTAFVIGSDVPPDIDCSATPDDPACAG